MTDHGARRFSLEEELDRKWLGYALLFWVATVAWLMVQRWPNITWLTLGDTDDNMRLMQVRALLAGQGWFDLTQYRLNPPGGLNIHWSRLVDLPIAGLILLLQPFIGTPWAERIACGLAPMLPLGVTMVAVAVTTRRLIAPAAWPVALIVLLGCTATMGMFMPMRIDHHGWQLACLAWTVAGLIDPRRARGGLVVGLSSAVSLTIGLEMLPYCAGSGAIVALRWVWDRHEARRLTAYALALGGGSAFGFVAFGSYANQVMRCDALTPVWLSVMVAAGALLFLLARLNPEQRWQRLALAVLAGAAIVAGFVGFFPQCLGRPEGVSVELQQTWLNNVREAKPIYQHPLRTAFPLAVLPTIGVIGALVFAWRRRGTPQAMGWATLALFTAFAGALLLWQVRAGPAGQLLAVPGATAIVWAIVPWCLGHRWMAVRVLGSVAAFMLASGLFAGFVIQYLPIDKPSPRSQIVSRANSRCATIPSLKPLDRLPATVLFTHVDLGPRLVVVTHHDGITGPYHRNGDAILDVHHAFTGTPAQFREIAWRHHATHLLICPNMAETTVYRAHSKNGFYGQLARGDVPGWLVPVKLPKRSPLRLFRIDYDAAGMRPPEKLALRPSMTN